MADSGLESGQTTVDLVPEWERAILRAAQAFTRRWLVVVCLALVVFTSLPLLAPLLMEHGMTAPASLIYRLYRLTCHQLPYRSFFIAGPSTVYSKSQIESQTDIKPLNDYVGSEQAGYKMAYCERDTAIYLMILAMALFMLVAGRRLPRLPLWLFVLMLLPIAIDGTTQLTGLRESTWLLRIVTGGLFGLAVAWLLFPVVDEAMQKAAAEFGERSASSPA